jgi:hypothetical protein
VAVELLNNATKPSAIAVGTPRHSPELHPRCWWCSTPSCPTRTAEQDSSDDGYHDHADPSGARRASTSAPIINLREAGHVASTICERGIAAVVYLFIGG